jgi:predicted outer membrane repeat protein
MKAWIKSAMESVFGPMGPVATIRRRGFQPTAEALENRLVPAGPTPAIFTVTTALDNAAHPGFVSLRDAINSANSNGDPSVTDVIKFAPGLVGKTIKLDSSFGELRIFQSVAIKGLGTGSLFIDGGAVGGEGGSRIFNVFGGEGSFPTKATFTGMTLQNGNSQGGGEENTGGGAIETTNFISQAGANSITVQHCVFRNNNSTDTGGAIHVTQSFSATIQDSTFKNNTSGNEGGAVCFQSSGTLLIERSTFAGNHVIGEEQGGAVAIENSSQATINASTFNGNVSGGEGGALGVRGANLTLQNSTIYGNTAGGQGGGIWFNGNGEQTGTLTLRNDTIAKNKATGGPGGGVLNEGGTVNVLNTIIDGNQDFENSALVANDISSGESEGGAVWNVQYSLIHVVPPNTINGTNVHNIFGFAAGLGPLQNNGGPTMTCAITTASKAYRAGSVSLIATLTTDQRGPGFFRVVSGFVDMGAFEVQAAVRRVW